MAKISQSYETVMVFSCKNEDAIPALVEKFQKLIAENATIDGVEEWGKKRLAYPINDMAEGYYVLMNCECKPELPAELDRVFKITEGILRSLIIAVEE